MLYIAMVLAVSKNQSAIELGPTMVSKVNIMVLSMLNQQTFLTSLFYLVNGNLENA